MYLYEATWHQVRLSPSKKRHPGSRFYLTFQGVFLPGSGDSAVLLLRLDFPFPRGSQINRLFLGASTRLAPNCPNASGQIGITVAMVDHDWKKVDTLEYYTID